MYPLTRGKQLFCLCFDDYSLPLKGNFFDQTIKNSRLAYFTFCRNIETHGEAHGFLLALTWRRYWRASAKTMTGVVAHELSIPIAMLSNESKLCLTLVKVIKKHHKLFPKDDIPPDEFKLLKEAKQTIESRKNKLDYADKVLEIMLNNAKNSKIFTEEASKVSIDDCVKEALSSYPYKNLDTGKKLINVNMEKHFEFIGSKSLIVHVLYNLLKNSFKAIKLAGKGEIFIYTKSKLGLRCLVVEDTALGMEKHQVSNATEQFVAYWNDSTGLGLSFCKEVMASIGGYLEIAAENSKFTRVTL